MTCWGFQYGNRVGTLYRKDEKGEGVARDGANGGAEVFTGGYRRKAGCKLLREQERSRQQLSER